MLNLTQKNTMLVKEECISYNKMEKIHARHTKLHNSATIYLFTALQSILTPVRMSFLGAKRAIPKICNTYPTLMKHIPYIKKIQNIHKILRHLSSSADISKVTGNY